MALVASLKHALKVTQNVLLILFCRGGTCYSGEIEEVAETFLKCSAFIDPMTLIFNFQSLYNESLKGFSAFEVVDQWTLFVAT